MKKTTCVLTLLAAVLSALVLPSTVLAADVSHFRGKTAIVEFYALDPATCITTSVTVFAAENRFRNPPGPPESSTEAEVTIHQFDSCTWQNLICASGSFTLPNGAFDAAHNLSAASLSATAEVYDACNATDQTITLGVNWTGTGELLRGSSRTSSHAPGYHMIYRQRGRYRDAAATGSLMVGGTPLPLENGSGYLTDSTSGTITISN